MRHFWPITFCLIALSFVSIINILSLGVQTDGSIDLTELFLKHLTFILIGWTVYIVFSKIDYSIFKFIQTNVIFYLATLFLLIATILWGPVINNTQRWLLLGEFQFQPSEMAKVAIILVTASLFTYRNRFNETYLLLISFVLLLPLLSIIYIQPHGSMSIIIFLLWSILIISIMKNQLRNLLLFLLAFSSIASVLTFFFQGYLYFGLSISALIVIIVFAYYARESWRKMLIFTTIIGISIGILISITWNSLLLDYQKERINAFFNPTETSQSLGFNVDQSRVAIGSGRIFGKGWGLGTQSKLQFLPEYQTDFIFATFSEEFGLVGSFILIGIYSFLIFSILIVAFKSYKMYFEFVVLIGVGVKIFLEVFVNIGTNTGVIPATGIPLPLMSIGGTSILFFFFSLGLVQSIISNNNENYRELKYSHVDNDEVII